MEHDLPGDTPVCGHDKDGCHVILQGTVQEGEALDVQHVHLVNEQHLVKRKQNVVKAQCSVIRNPKLDAI